MLIALALVACLGAGDAVADLDTITELSHRVQQDPNDVEALNELIRIVRSDDSDRVIRANALTQLGVSGELHAAELSPRVLPVLRELARSPDLFLRRNAVRAIGSFGSDAADAVDDLIWVLEDPRDVDAKYFAARSLGQIQRQPEKVVPALLDLVSEASRSSIAGVEAVAAFGSPGRGPVVSALRGDEISRRAAAAWTLATMGDSTGEVEAAAVESLLSTSPPVRWLGVRTAGELIRRGRSSQALKDRLSVAATDSDDRVRNEAKDVLRSVSETGGRP